MSLPNVGIASLCAARLRDPLKSWGGVGTGGRARGEEGVVSSAVLPSSYRWEHN